MTTPHDPTRPGESSDQPATHSKRTRRTGLWVGIGVAALVVIALVIAAAVGVFSGGKPEASATPTATVENSAPASSEPATPSAEPSPSASVPAGAKIPADCRAAFTPAFLTEYEGRNPLNDATNTLTGSEDTAVVSLLASVSTHQLRCSLGGAGESGAVSFISQVNAEQQTAVITRTTARGGACEEYRGGNLCEIVTLEDEGIDRKWEQSYLRDGLWIQVESVQFLNKRELLDNQIDVIFGS
ncbi:hypothetical protein [Mycetocola saprophilus]|uniref:hypothetical protein n=1 Tax=Mycetocola saprophilus TaxID=76636 RepID=UPI0012DDBCBB|nr:hypothetical protein [Mycetocola saprophilus]